MVDGDAITCEKTLMPGPILLQEGLDLGVAGADSMTWDELTTAIQSLLLTEANEEEV